MLVQMRAVTGSHIPSPPPSIGGCTLVAGVGVGVLARAASSTTRRARARTKDLVSDESSIL